MRFALLLVFLVLNQSQALAQVMRWVDERGVVNYGTVVPERYKASARPVPVDKPPSEAQRKEAAARLRKDREALARHPAAAAPAKAAQPAHEPAPPGKAAASCEEQWRQFDAAWACFNPYRNANGSVKSEGYERCPLVKEPECQR